MAVSITTTPQPYSTRGIFVASTNQAEDATHINVRVEAQLLAGSTIFCKKTNTKALTTFDFTDVLRSFVGFTNPTPFQDPTTIEVISPSKTGSNLITSWANKTSYLFTTFTSSGANITASSGTPSGSNMMCETNSISFTAGKVYVLAWMDPFFTGQKPYIEIGSTGATPLGTYSNYIQSEIASAGGGKYYFLCKSTGSYKLTMGVKAGDGATSFYGTMELYEFEDHDWFKQYSIKFVEKWEDASGVTQTGTTADNFKMYTFFKSTLDETTFNSDYICDSNTSKFLAQDGYFSSARSVSQLRTPTGSNKSTSYLMAVISSSVPYYNIYYDRYGASSYISGISAIDDKYSPIACFPIHNGNIVTNQTYGIVYIQAGEPINGAISENNYITINNKCYPYHVELAWINEYGGASSFFFGDEYTSLRKAQRETYKTGALVQKGYNSYPVKEITASSHFIADDRQMEYLKDIITSPLVMEHTTAYREVMVQSDAIPVHRRGDLFNFEITYQYGD